MGHFDRRQFMKSLALGMGALCVSPLSALSVNSSANSRSKYQEGVNEQHTDKLKKEALELFYQRKYDLSEQKYKKLISLYPSDITCYDGLARVYKKLQEHTKVIVLYREGLKLNPDKGLFHDRLSRGLASLTLGNRKLEQIYSSTASKHPLQESSELYLSAIELSPNDSYFRYGLLEIMACIEKKNNQLRKQKLPMFQLSDSVQEGVKKTTQAYKGEWTRLKKGLNNIKKRSVQNPLQSLETISSKPRRKLYFDDEYQSRHQEIEKKSKDYYSLLFLSALNSKNNKDIEKYYQKLSQTDEKDTHYRGCLVKYYRKKEDLNTLLNLYQRELTDDPNRIWSKVCYALILLKKKEYRESQRLFLDLLKTSDRAPMPKLQGAIYGGLSKTQFALGDYDSGRKTLLEGIDKITICGVTTSLINAYAESYLQQKKYNEAQSVLIALVDDESIAENPVLAKVIGHMKELHRYRSPSVNLPSRMARMSARTLFAVPVQGKDSNLDELKSLYVLAKLYRKTQDKSKLEEILNRIKMINPQDSFLKKGISY